MCEKIETVDDDLGRTAFALAYAAWMKARANLADLETQPNISDEEFGEALNRKDEAEWEMIKSPAENFLDIRLRAKAVQAIFEEVEIVGLPGDGRHIAQLNRLVSEIQAI